MAAGQELQVQEKRELQKKEEPTIPVRVFVPATDILEDEQSLTVVMEMPGVNKDAVNINLQDRVLTVEGRKTDKGKREFLYRGISSRPFKRQFNLADYVRVKSAQFDNGLLQVELVREIPEAMKARRIPIDNLAASDVQQLEPRAA